MIFVPVVELVAGHSRLALSAWLSASNTPIHHLQLPGRQTEKLQESNSLIFPLCVPGSHDPNQIKFRHDFVPDDVKCFRTGRARRVPWHAVGTPCVGSGIASRSRTLSCLAVPGARSRGRLTSPERTNRGLRPCRAILQSKRGVIVSCFFRNCRRRSHSCPCRRSYLFQLSCRPSWQPDLRVSSRRRSLGLSCPTPRGPHLDGSWYQQRGAESRGEHQGIFPTCLHVNSFLFSYKRFLT